VIVDDNITVAETLMIALDRAGHAVHRRTTSIFCWRRISRRPTGSCWERFP